MYVALEKYLNQDHDKEWKDWEDRLAQIDNTVKKIGGVTTEIRIPPLGNHTPTLHITWDTERIKLADKQLRDALRNGIPSIEVGGGTSNSVSVTVFMLKPGQEKIVAARLKEELSKASA
jgi:L-seryl-tRNA(Ser) seleniumtransferase